MKIDKIWKTAWKLTKATCIATGIVAASGVVACCAATGSVAGGFMKAKKAVEGMFAKEETAEAVEEAAEKTEE